MTADLSNALIFNIKSVSFLRHPYSNQQIRNGTQMTLMPIGNADFCGFLILNPELLSSKHKPKNGTQMTQMPIGNADLSSLTRSKSVRICVALHPFYTRAIFLSSIGKKDI